MSSPSTRTAAALIALVGLAPLNLAQPPAATPAAAPPDSPALPAPTPPRPIMADESAKALRNEEPNIQARVTRIKAELAALDRKTLKDDDWAKEWAGEYYEGDGLGENVNIHLAPKSGIGFLNYGCVGLYGGDHGDIVEALPDGLKLKLALGKKHGSFLSDRIFLIKWGDQRFLVPEWAMMTVVNNYNEGGFARSSMFGIPRLCRDGQPFRGPVDAPPGKPQLPAEYAKLLRDAPLLLKVTKATPIQSRLVTNGVSVYQSTIEFEGGTDQGVYLDMEFKYPAASAALRGTVKITRVDAKTCTGTLRAFGGETDTYKPPEVGERVPTGPDPIATPVPDKVVPKEPAKK